MGTGGGREGGELVGTGGGREGGLMVGTGGGREGGVLVGKGGGRAEEGSWRVQGEEERGEGSWWGRGDQGRVKCGANPPHPPPKGIPGFPARKSNSDLGRMYNKVSLVNSLTIKGPWSLFYLVGSFTWKYICKKVHQI